MYLPFRFHADPFAPAVLEPLRDHGNLWLKDKRILACVNKEARRIFTEHLRRYKLYVAGYDCTYSNARFVMKHLLPAMQKELLLCVDEDEESLCPEMHLGAIQHEPRLRVYDKKKNLVVSTTTAFFLGYALAHSDCKIRLTTGKLKCLKALRENDRIELTVEETASLIDRRIMAGALHANAERRIQDTATDLEGGVVLAHLQLSSEVLASLMPSLRRRMTHIKTLDLSHNAFGSNGVNVLFGEWEQGMYLWRELTAFSLSGTGIGDPGMHILAKAINESQLQKVQHLLLSDVGMGDEGLQALAPQLRRLQELVTLDLSDNRHVGEKGMAALLDSDNLPLPKLEILNLLNMPRVPVTSFKLLATVIKEEKMPVLQQLCSDRVGARKALRLALSRLSSDRSWKAFADKDPELRQLERKRKKSDDADSVLFRNGVRVFRRGHGGICKGASSSEEDNKD